MRYIKFRAWNKDVKVMLNFDLDYIYDWILHHNNSEKGGYVCMQFTGLHDKNGKEIYEGDIVKFPLFDNHKIMEHLIGTVIFHEGSFKVDVLNESKYFINREKLEVIGNIYENPELLEDSK